ncbi:ferredoxin [Drepanopeziza brunnea f. sp. 'multigermtubi' MB_m1]|uniref:Ferredoxin n=1 Tax=Marssonina brunnea f. sp. multigermtubi (strain MB_m1) TaxID=1072389 RepID=K1WKG6_MARBU|nr:ferredoxin [Drepanopeziza brunnea f. sp. 'multigermtubi' MB_m1]EKD13381.1 ferredoxin [Drepanopeziza brunnea f. sp. 'multigermtubi' MB_m1]
MFDKLDEASDEENDMLDLAFGLTETSRLGCQITMTPELNGLVVKLPSMTRNMQKSDFEQRKSWCGRGGDNTWSNNESFMKKIIAHTHVHYNAVPVPVEES